MKQEVIDNVTSSITDICEQMSNVRTFNSSELEQVERLRLSSLKLQSYISAVEDSAEDNQTDNYPELYEALNQAFAMLEKYMPLTRNLEYRIGQKDMFPAVALRDCLSDLIDYYEEEEEYEYVDSE